MQITKMRENIHQLSVNVEHILFEGLWEMPRGVSIHSYVVKGRETALIDGVCGWDGVPESLFAMLDEMKIELKDIRYLVLNHLEPDHSGWLEPLFKLHRDFTVVCSEKGAALLDAFFDSDVPVRVVKDDDEIDLGDGVKLTFKMIPNVHWPDAMVTYEPESKTLFSCDAFGSFGKLEGSPFDGDYSDDALAAYEGETVRYYSNIIGAFSPFVLKALKKLEPLDIVTVAPAHGMVWSSHPETILEAYRRYANASKEPSGRKIVLLWGSMYGNTERAVRVAESVLKSSGMPYSVYNVMETSWGTILADLWMASGVILAMPTYEYKMFPPMAAVLEEIGKKKAQGKLAYRFGSYGWSGGAQRELDDLMDRLNMNWTFIEPFEFKGRPNESDLERIHRDTESLIRGVDERLTKADNPDE